MEESDRKVGKTFLVFVGLCVLALPLVILSALSYEPKQTEAVAVETHDFEFDEKGKAIFETYNRIAKDYLKGSSSERTLSEYYSRRQYLGSPPYIPHTVEEADRTQIACLTCHAGGASPRSLIMQPLRLMMRRVSTRT